MLLDSAHAGKHRKKEMHRAPSSPPLIPVHCSFLPFADQYCICQQSEKEDAQWQVWARIRRLATLPLIRGLTGLPTGRQEQHTHLVERSKI